MKWRYEIKVYDALGNLLIHTGHDTEASRDRELELLRLRANLEAIGSVVLISNDTGKVQRLYP